MTMSRELIEEEALKLAPEERALLADRLVASIVPRLAFEAEWRVELDRRLAAVESGEEELIPAEKALAEARRAIA